jgi:hypothetical protein
MFPYVIIGSMTKVKNPIQPGDGDPRHGTAGAYSNHGCRCPLCTEAQRVKQVTYMNADPERLRLHAERMSQRRALNRK